MGVMNKFMNFLGLSEEEETVTREQIQHDEFEEMEPVPPQSRKNKGNVVSIHSQKNIRVVLSEPRSYDEAQEIADHLRSRRPCVINMQRVRPEQAIRIVDFLSGTIYALNGSISKVGTNIFLCTPENVEIQGAITEMLGDEGRPHPS